MMCQDDLAQNVYHVQEDNNQQFWLSYDLLSSYLDALCWKNVNNHSEHLQSVCDSHSWPSRWSHNCTCFFSGFPLLSHIPHHMVFFSPLRSQLTVLHSKPNQIPQWWFPLWVQCQDQRLKQGCSILSQTSHITFIFHAWSIAKAHMHHCGSHSHQDEAQRQLSSCPVSDTDRPCKGGQNNWMQWDIGIDNFRMTMNPVCTN